MKNLNDITAIIVDSSVKIHKRFGPGLLESVYELVMTHELEKRGLVIERQKSISIEYEGLILKDAFRADLFVENAVVVELKSVENLLPVHGKQLLTYLRLMELPIGLLINFGAATMKEGLHRIMNGWSGFDIQNVNIDQLKRNKLG